MARCDVCFRHCDIKEGGVGFCGARSCKNGAVVPKAYGRITSAALDPIEKKPLARFHPRSMIFSVGSFGCNLRCPFCQNYSISWSEEAMSVPARTSEAQPEELCAAALRYKSRGNIGIAFTYNEPLINYEFFLDTAKLAHENGLLTVLVTNGTAEPEIFEKAADNADAMNIDLKGFTENYYKNVLKGDLEIVKENIRTAVKLCHTELTTLIVPGENDSPEEMRELSRWVSELTGKNGERAGTDVPLHISRFFPRFQMTDRGPTDTGLIYALTDIARERLKYVYAGNVPARNYLY